MATREKAKSMLEDILADKGGLQEELPPLEAEREGLLEADVLFIAQERANLRMRAALFWGNGQAHEPPLQQYVPEMQF